MSEDRLLGFYPKVVIDRLYTNNMIFGSLCCAHARTHVLAACLSDSSSSFVIDMVGLLVLRALESGRTCSSAYECQILIACEK